MKNSVELRDKISSLKEDAHKIIELCKSEKREMSEEEQKSFDETKAQIEDLKKQLFDLEAKLKSYDEQDPSNEKEPDGDEHKSCGGGASEENKTERNMKKTQFSLLKAIRSVANNEKFDDATLAVINEGKKEARNSGLSITGQIQIPTETRDGGITVETEHDNVVVTDFANIMEPLRANNVLSKVGAKFLTGLVGDVQVPIMSAENVTWEGETAPATDGKGSFTNIKLQPKRLTAYIDISKQFLAQDSLGAEALIRKDLINAIQSKLEATILGTEAGSATQPAGIFNGATIVTATDFAKLCTMESGLEDANILGMPKYIVSPTAKAALRAMSKGTKSTQLVWEGNAIDGTPAEVTTNVAKNNLVYGDFSNLAIGQWSAVDLTVDPYTQAGNGMIRLTINAFFDAKVLRKAAFVFGTTAIA